MHSLAQFALTAAKAIQNEAPVRTPPAEGAVPLTEQIIPSSIVRGTRGYVEAVVHQINGTYEHGCFDACAVMIRRLVETLIVEVFEHHGISDKIQDQGGNYLYLRELVNRMLAERSWHLGRETKQALPRLKEIGDRSAHAPRFLAHRADIDNIRGDLRVVAQELVIRAELK